jgi:hypothetical protein
MKTSYEVQSGHRVFFEIRGSAPVFVKQDDDTIDVIAHGRRRLYVDDDCTFTFESKGNFVIEWESVPSNRYQEVDPEPMVADNGSKGSMLYRMQQRLRARSKGPLIDEIDGAPTFYERVSTALDDEPESPVLVEDTADEDQVGDTEEQGENEEGTKRESTENG